MLDLLKLNEPFGLSRIFGGSFINDLAEACNSLVGDSDVFADFENKGLVDEGDKYVLTINVHSKANADNAEVVVDDDVLIVSYSYTDGDNHTSSKVTETLPDDADADNIDAVIEDGKFVVTVGKKVIEPEPEEDKTKVHVTRLSCKDGCKKKSK